jgi:hypothetical protein
MHLARKAGRRSLALVARKLAMCLSCSNVQRGSTPVHCKMWAFFILRLSLRARQINGAPLLCARGWAPSLVPDMTYEGMLVAGGQDAWLAWESLIRGGLDRDEHQRVRKALLDYCGQDTLALIKLVERLPVGISLSGRQRL